MPLDNSQSYLEAIVALTNAQSVCMTLPAFGHSQTNSISWGSYAHFTEFQHASLPNILDPEVIDGDCDVRRGEQANTLIIGAAIRQTSLSQSQGEGHIQPSRRAPLAESRRWLWTGLHYAHGLPDWADEAIADADSLPQGLIELLQFGGKYLETSQDYRSILVDPLTSLPGRARFQTLLSHMLEQHAGVSVLMVHCAEFQLVNRKFGHDAGDQVIEEIAQRLQQQIRKEDILSRFGGALFALAAPVAGAEKSLVLAQKLQRALQDGHYLGGAATLAFNIGLTQSSSDENFTSLTDAIGTLVTRADQALKTAQAASQPCVTLWQSDHAALSHQQADYIGGIFTSDTATDYRNMLLLWDLSNLIATESHPQKLLKQVIERLAQTFDFELGGIAQQHSDTSKLEFELFDVDQNERVNAIDAQQAVTIAPLAMQVRDVLSDLAACTFELEGKRFFAAPLCPDGKGALLLGATPEQLDITQDALFLLSGLAKQVGRALVRAEDELARNQALTQRQTALEHELSELKASFRDVELFYQSEQMDALMVKAKRAATTNTTTLIIGESGTGKERLAHAIHAMSTRNDKPLVIVDCGSIPETLIESELFGHVKGAFTGALSDNLGKVAEANDGTLILDEIGELPLQMQTKLLRFVQEKQYSRVGSAKTETVDVKIVAITNRELEDEVRQGRFRQDLFYRLNVLTLRTPPLRQRPADVDLLAKYFLKKFSAQFDEPVKTLSDNALQLMRQYAWPGNVRELENRLMQACLMAQGAIIEWSTLGIDERPISEDISTSLPTNTGTTEPAPVRDVQEPQDVAEHQRFEQTELKDRVRNFCQSTIPLLQPIWPHVEKLVMLKTFERSSSRINTMALRLGLPISTARRRLDKLLKMPEPGWPEQAADSLFDYLDPLLDGKMPLGNEGLKHLRMLTLEVLLELIPTNHNQVAQLMGVSEPTIYKWKKELNLAA